ncbi:hypothetical protein [Nonomuraea sp. B19D2]|uniref:hypothetical protein n=1 Tax=Nonomuraea sp. B19D2 TaxID=3159561 RepID=UPI0032DAC4F3
MSTNALPPVVDAGTWQRQLEALRVRESGGSGTRWPDIPPRTARSAPTSARCAFTRTNVGSGLRPFHDLRTPVG